MASFDLHLHSNWSYDAFAPVNDFFRFAAQKNLRAIAVTDHHLMDAADEILQAAAKFPETGFFSGSEVSVSTPFGLTDLVCLNLPVKPTGKLNELFNIYRRWQVNYGGALSEILTARGCPLTEEKRMELLKSYRPAAAVAKQGNTHVAYGKLFEFCRNYPEAVPDSPALMKILDEAALLAPYPDFSEIVPGMKAAGAVIFIAHPFELFLKNDRRRMDAMREMLQLDGIECVHPSIPAEITPFYRQYCREHDLLSSAGSDLHFPQIEKIAAIDAPDYFLDEICERVTLHHGS